MISADAAGIEREVAVKMKVDSVVDIYARRRGITEGLSPIVLWYFDPIGA